MIPNGTPVSDQAEPGRVGVLDDDGIDSIIDSITQIEVDASLRRTLAAAGYAEYRAMAPARLPRSEPYVAVAERGADDQLAAAQREVDRLLAEAREHAERVVRDAYTRAQAVEREAHERHQSVLGRLEAERDHLQAQRDHLQLQRDQLQAQRDQFQVQRDQFQVQRDQLQNQVETLRAFEREYRARLMAYLDDQMRQLREEAGLGTRPQLYPAYPPPLTADAGPMAGPGSAPPAGGSGFAPLTGVPGSAPPAGGPGYGEA
ncbi:hypothetical protein E1091_09970 [Micromonospora fluostatini]|uniref:Cell division protein DivIVA n=1 Tax=Micromonospora fluostatini TaxID=1629071 RepID=A0ABY2DGZ8_9ACTN|nr:hypothetical protein E1091_09970 [Micromonospora fluostatini]